MSNNQMMRFHAFVKGRVQGVGFRAFVVEKGLAVGATGWARNRWDGSVEVVAEGDQQVLEELLAALRIGPRVANVTKVDLDWEAASGEFSSFRVKSTF
jgi:acylphosphatase